VLHRIVRKPSLVPHGRHLRIAVQSELRHESGEHAEESIAIIEARARELIESIDAIRSPIAISFDDERTLARLEPNAHGVRRALRQHLGGGVEQR